MAKIRPSNERLDKLLSDKVYIETKINECMVFIEHSKSPLWKALKEQIDNKLDHIMDSMGQWRTLGDVGRIGLLAQREVLLEISDFLTDAVAVKKQFEQMLLDKEIEISDYRKKLDNGNGN